MRVLILFDRLHWLWLALAAPFLLFPSPNRSLVMLVVPALYLLHWLALRGKQQTVPGETQVTNYHRPSVIPRTPLNGALLLMLLMVLVSLWATFDINYSLPKISGMVLGLGIYFAFSRAGQTSRGWWFGFLLFLGIGFGIATIGLLGTHWLTKIAFLTPIVSHLAPRITGLPGAEEGFHPNLVAGALLWVIPSLFASSWLLLIKAKDLRNFLGRGRTNAVILFTIGVSLWTIAILILTQSREGYIDLALTLSVLIPTALHPKWRWHSLGFVTLLALILAVLFASHWEGVRSWIVGSDLAADPALSFDSLQVRSEVWTRAIYGIQDFPFTGIGMNTFRKVVLVLYPLFNISPEIDIGHAHNEFLQAALDLGIPGLIAFIALYIIAFWMLVRTMQSVHANVRSASSRVRSEVILTKPGGHLSVLDSSPLADARLAWITVLGLGGGLLAHMLWGLTDAMALGARPAFVFWIILGLISGLHDQAQEHSAVVDSNVSTTDP